MPTHSSQAAPYKKVSLLAFKGISEIKTSSQPRILIKNSKNCKDHLTHHQDMGSCNRRHHINSQVFLSSSARPSKLIMGAPRIGFNPHWLLSKRNQNQNLWKFRSMTKTEKQKRRFIARRNSFWSTWSTFRSLLHRQLRQAKWTSQSTATSRYSTGWSSTCNSAIRFRKLTLLESLQPDTSSTGRNPTMKSRKRNWMKS